jgi:hypothetical protein
MLPDDVLIKLIKFMDYESFKSFSLTDKNVQRVYKENEKLINNYFLKSIDKNLVKFFFNKKNVSDKEMLDMYIKMKNDLHFHGYKFASSLPVETRFNTINHMIKSFRKYLYENGIIVKKFNYNEPKYNKLLDGVWVMSLMRNLGPEELEAHIQFECSRAIKIHRIFYYGYDLTDNCLKKITYSS